MDKIDESAEELDKKSVEEQAEESAKMSAEELDKKLVEELSKKMRRSYNRDWSHNNRDKCRQYTKNYWLRKAEKELKDRNNESGESQ
jgi:hypothetical protein